ESVEGGFSTPTCRRNARNVRRGQISTPSFAVEACSDAEGSSSVVRERKTTAQNRPEREVIVVRQKSEEFPCASACTGLRLKRTALPNLQQPFSFFLPSERRPPWLNPNR